MNRIAGRRGDGTNSCTIRSRRSIIDWRSAFACLLLAGPLTIDTAVAEGKLLFEFEEGVDFSGQVQRATYDRSGIPWVASYREIFRVDHGVPVPAANNTSRDRLLAIAPGGGRLVWLDSRKAPYGQFAVELLELNQAPASIGELRSREPPAGFGTLHMSREGRLLVGVTALSDLEGWGGDFRYTFWSGDGKWLGSVNLEGRRIGIPDDSGESILLLGESDATSRQSDGTEIWSVTGEYRDGASGAAGNVALLNPARQIEEVHLVRPGIAATVLKMSSPVYDLAITPDGLIGAIATGDGRISIVNLQTCVAAACPITRLPRLPILSRHFITAVRFIDRRSIAVGAIQVAGSGPYRRFYAGIVLVLSTTGELEFIRSIGLPQPATWSPSLDVTYGSKAFAAYTPSAAMFVSTEN